jgi:hypothetical protein
MSKERELLQEALEWMEELNYVYADSRNSGDRLALELRADINKIELLLTQAEQPTREPLSTKQAEDLWETTFKSAVPYYIFDEICVAIEQYHEIGVADE